MSLPAKERNHINQSGCWHNDDQSKYERYPDLSGVSIKVAFYYCPIGVIKINKASKVEYEGLEMSIIKELSKKTNLTIHLKEITSKNKWGMRKLDGTYEGGILGNISERKVDMAICSLWVTIHQYHIMDISTSIGQSHLAFMISKLFKEEWLRVYEPFTYHVWLSLFICFVLERSVAKLIQKYSKRGHNGLAGRFLSTWRGLMGLLACSAYSGIVVGHLTSPGRESRVDTIGGLVAGGYTWGKINGKIENLQPHIKDGKYSVLSERFVPVSTRQDLKNKLDEGKFALLVETTGDLVFAELPLETVLDVDLSRVRETLRTYNLALGLVRGSRLTPVVNKLIEDLKSGGLLSKWGRDSFRLWLGEVYAQKGPPPQAAEAPPFPITASGLAGAWVLLAAGIGVSMMALAGELLCHRWGERSKDVKDH